MIPIFNLIISAIGIFLTSLIFSMFGRGGGEFYLPIMISLLPIDYYTAAGISLFIIMLQGLSMLIVYHGRHRLVDWGLALVLGFAIGLASFLGGYLSYRIPAYLLKLSFSIKYPLSHMYIICKEDEDLLQTFLQALKDEFKKLYISVKGRGEKLFTTTGVYKFEE